MPGIMADQPDEWEQDYRAVTEGLRDYAQVRLQKVVLGMSGGSIPRWSPPSPAMRSGPERALRDAAQRIYPQGSL